MKNYLSANYYVTTKNIVIYDCSSVYLIGKIQVHPLAGSLHRDIRRETLLENLDGRLMPLIAQYIV